MAAERILVVDDDDTIRQVVRLCLADEGYDVFEAPNGLVALQLLAACRPSLILLDLRMPVMDGWEFARRFRDQFHASTPIIVVTAAESAAQRCREISADAWLAKPFDLDALRELVRKLLPHAEA